MDEDLCTTDRSLKNLIKQHGYTQKTFAKALNKSLTAVEFYMTQKRVPSAQVIADMCRLLDESPKTVLKSLGIDVTGIPDDRIDD